ncbi:hypothetical protein FHW88_004161 [Mucilaginibacter sp. SG538B]|nr:hypothetical protein [Mucilaginibacter sp. SG538B]
MLIDEVNSDREEEDLRSFRNFAGLKIGNLT